MEQGPGSQDRRALALAAGGALLLALGLTWPVALHPTTRLVGHPGNDVWNHAWGYAWVGEALAQGHLPEHTDLLAFPRGGALTFIDAAGAVLTAPLQLLGGPALAYNAAMVGGLAGAAFGAWLLARRECGNGLAAMVAAVIFGASPHLLGQAYNGISETVCAGWLPLSLVALLRLLDRPGPRAALILAVVAALGAWSSWYYGLFSALAGLIIVVHRAAVAPRSLRAALPALLGAALGAGAGVAPALIRFRATLDAPDALVTRDPEFVAASLSQHNLTDLLAFARPGRTPSPDLRALYGEELLIVIYLGLVALALAGAGLWFSRRQRKSQVWLWVGLIFFVFSLGPTLSVNGEPVTVLGRRLPLPFLPLFDALPIFSRISHPFRFSVGLSLAIAVYAARGVEGLFRGRARAWAAPLLSAAVLLEVSLASPARVPIPTSDARIPDAVAALGASLPPGAVLDLPMALPNLERAIYLWYQTAHRRAVPWGLNEPMPALLLENRFTATLLRVEASRAGSLPPRLPELDLVVGARQLARLGFAAVVVHARLYPKERREQVLALIGATLGAPLKTEDADVLVYPLDPARRTD